LNQAEFSETPMAGEVSTTVEYEADAPVENEATGVWF